MLKMTLLLFFMVNLSNLVFGQEAEWLVLNDSLKVYFTKTESDLYLIVDEKYGQILTPKDGWSYKANNGKEIRAYSDFTFDTRKELLGMDVSEYSYYIMNYGLEYIVLGDRKYTIHPMQQNRIKRQSKEVLIHENRYLDVDNDTAWFTP